MQIQKGVYAYFTSKQILPFGVAGQSSEDVFHALLVMSMQHYPNNDSINGDKLLILSSNLYYSELGSLCDPINCVSRIRILAYILCLVLSYLTLLLYSTSRIVSYRIVSY